MSQGRTNCSLSGSGFYLDLNNKGLLNNQQEHDIEFGLGRPFLLLQSVTTVCV